MLPNEMLRLLGTVVALVMGTGTIVVGVVQAIGRSKDEAEAFATEAIKVAVDERKSHEENIQKSVEALKILRDTDQVQILARLNEIDLWRKDINGQLKLIGAHMEFSNKLLEEQKNATTSLAASNQQMAIVLAGMQQVCRLKSGGEA